MGLICKFSGHKWNGCICERCNAKRDEHHDWDGCKCSKCGKAISVADINGLTNQATLFNIVKTAPMMNITQDYKERLRWRKAAASAATKRITDQYILADIAKHSYNNESSIVIQAMEQITDISILIDIMKYDKFSGYVFQKAADLYPDVCVHIAKDKSIIRDKRVAAFAYTKDKSVFSDDELRELEEMKALEAENRDKYSVNTLPTQSWEYS